MKIPTSQPSSGAPRKRPGAAPPAGAASAAPAASAVPPATALPGEPLRADSRSRAPRTDHVAAVALLQAEEEKEVFGRLRIPIYPFVTAIIFIFVLLEIPFSKPSIPQPIMIALGFFSAAVIIFMALESIFLTILLLTAFLPYSNLFPGTFGQFLMAFNLTNILTLVICFGWFARGAIHRERMFFSNAGNLLVLTYMGIAVYSIGRSYIDAEGTFDLIIRLKRYLTPIFFYYLFANNVRLPVQIRFILVTICIATTGAAVMAIKEAVLDIGTMGSWEKMRIKGITGQPNELAAFFSYFAPLMLAYFLLRIRERAAWLMLGPLMLCFYATVRTFSRGGLISFVFAMIATLFFWRRKAGVAAIGVGVCLIMFFPNAIPSSISARFKTTFISTGDPESTFASERLEQSASLRLLVWEAALERIIKPYPFTGVGFGRFIQYIGRDAHNGYILIAAEMGLPALFIFLWMFWRFGRASYGLMRSPDFACQWLGLSYLGAIGGLLASNCFGSRLNTQEVSSYIWILAGMIMMARQRMRDGEPLYAYIPHDRATGDDPVSSITEPTRKAPVQNAEKGYTVERADGEEPPRTSLLR